MIGKQTATLDCCVPLYLTAEKYGCVPIVPYTLKGVYIFFFFFAVVPVLFCCLKWHVIYADSANADQPAKYTVCPACSGHMLEAATILDGKAYKVMCIPS